MTDFAATRKHTAAFQAAILLMEEGAMPPETLYSRVHFGETSDSRKTTLMRAIEAGWLKRGHQQYIEVTPEAREFLATGEVKTIKPTGSIATGPTINMLTRPPLSRKYILNPRGSRADVPEWSHRPEGFTLRTVA